MGDECTDDEMAMEVRKEGAIAKVSKYLLPEWVSNFFRLPERQSYFALATFIGNEMADYYISILIVFLEEFLGMDPIRAVKVKSFQEGGSRGLAVFVAYFTDVYVGQFLMLFLSALLYSVGFGILHFSKEDPITTLSVYFALVLITIGISGAEFSLRGFQPKKRGTSPNNLIESGPGNQRKCYCCPRFTIHWKWLCTMRGQWRIFYIIVPIITLFVLSFFNFTWPRTFLILTFMMGNSLIFLLLSILFYTPRKPYGSLRCLEKAGCFTQQEGPSSRQNPSIKVLIHILPMSIPFIIFGMVIAIGETLFLAQASTMHVPKFGEGVLKVEADALACQVLVLVSKIGNYGTAAVYDLIAKKIGVAEKRSCHAIKLGLAMLLPILGCATASAVEAKRLRIIKENKLLEVEVKDYTVPMNVYWLVPQFFFLGAMDKVASDGIEGFLTCQTVPLMKIYAPTVADSMTGVGVLLGIPFQLRFIKKANEDGIDYIGMGHLKKYYILLTALSAGNFLLYVVLALFYMYWKRKQGEF